MSVVIETTLGDITVDLYLSDRPRACLNFLKLCKIKYYNYSLFHTISRGFIAQTGDPTGSRSGGESIFGVLDGPLKRYFEGENEPRIKHTKMGLISFVGNEERMIGSQFFLTLGEDLTYLDEKHCVFGEVVEGFDILEVINEVICDTDDRPYQDVRITHTVILDDSYPDPKRLVVPSRSPSPSVERLQGGRIAPDEEIDEMAGKNTQEMTEMQAEREAKARATILEMVGDLPDADMAPPENVLFVCKLNPVTSDDDLEIIFSRFGKIKSCEVIRDKKTGDSLQYAFVEFEEQKSCEDAYFKMDNVLIDDRRIHVDFSQSVSKVKWHGKGRGVTHYDEKGRKSRDGNTDIGKGNYKVKKSNNSGKDRDRSRSPSDQDNRKWNPSNSNSRSDKSRSRNEREKSPPRRRRDLSPQKDRRKSDRESSSRYIQEGRRNRERSASPKRRGASLSKYRNPSPQNNRTKRRYFASDNNYSRRGWNNSQMSRRDRESYSRDNKRRDKSRSPRRNSDTGRGNGYDRRSTKNRDNAVASCSSKTAFSESKSRNSDESRDRVASKSNKRKTKSKSSSSDSDNDSDSDSDQRKKKKTTTSDSSDSDDSSKKKSKKKKVKKRSKYSSHSDLDDYKNKKTKKKKQKHETDSD